MKPGQRMTRWWQRYVLGGLRPPSPSCGRRAENPDAYEDRFTAAPQDDKEWTVPARLAKPNFLVSSTYVAQQQRADWQQCDYRMRLLAAKVVLRAGGLGIPLYVHSAFRTKAQQDALVSRGVTKVSYPRSAHNIGEAFDLVHGVYHWELTQREWLFIHHLVMDELRSLNAKLKKDQKLQVNWGGDDGTPQDPFKWDPAHYEVLDYRSRIRMMPVALSVHMSPAVTVKRYR